MCSAPSPRGRSVRSGQGQAHSATVVSPFSVPHPHPLSRNPLWSPPPSQEAPSLSWGGEMTGSVGRSKSDQRHLARSVPGLRPGWKWGRGLERCGERNRYGGKAELQRREDRRMAWEEASQSGTKSHRQTPSQGASEAGGPEVLQRFAPASPAVAPSLTRAPSAGETSRSPPNLDLALQPKAWDPRPHHELDPRWWGVERWLHSPQ